MRQRGARRPLLEGWAEWALAGSMTTGNVCQVECRQQEFFVFRGDVKTLAGLLDERRRPGFLFSEPCDSAAQGVPFGDDGRNGHWPLAAQT